MKVIIIYSGKGGVGKTTTTSNIAKALAEAGQKTFILDADVNTPSMPVIFPNENPNEFIKVASLGYGTKKSIYVTDSSIRSYISECIDSINKYKPDYVLIDTPPSITDVHINLLEKIKPSGLIIVTQPNALSLTDVNRTALFFQERNANIIGVVENMVTEETKNTYSWKVLGSIAFEKNFNFENVYKNSKDIYKSIAATLADLDSVLIENKKRQLFDETITTEDIDGLYFKSPRELKFINLKTWDHIVELISEMEFGITGWDKMISENTTERIGRMIKCFEADEKAYFMITKAPQTTIKVLPGEIGQGSLSVAKSYYGIPRIKYHTSQGEVVLFPHEIKPISTQELLLFLNEGYKITKDGRYIPSKDDLREIEAAFGSGIGLPADWELLYDQIINGDLPKINELQTNVKIEEKSKRRKDYEHKTIGSMREFHGLK